MGAITLTPLAQHRLIVLNTLQRGELKMGDAARLLDLSGRQVRRLRARYRTQGPAARVHGIYGRTERYRELSGKESKAYVIRPKHVARFSQEETAVG